MSEAPPPPDREAPTPRWVYAAGTGVIVVAVAFVIWHLSSGGIPTHLQP